MRLLVLISLLLTTVVGHADDRVRLQEIIPALAGTPTGALDLGPAPLPGSHKSIRRAQVEAALSAAGMSSRGLAIPRTTRVERRSRNLGPKRLEQLVRGELESTLSPCALEKLELPNEITVADGDIEVRAQATRPRQSGRIGASIELISGGYTKRMVVNAIVDCPAPVIDARAQVRIVAIFGNVRASAPGVAAQSGRVGDVIRVTNLVTQTSLQARISDEKTVEVMQ